MSGSVFAISYYIDDIVPQCEEEFKDRDIQAIATILRSRVKGVNVDDVYFVTRDGTLVDLSVAEYNRDMNVMLYFGSKDDFEKGRKKITDSSNNKGLISELTTKIIEGIQRSIWFN
ncbi:hypothetical protein GGI08_001430 [Coemansia sp. S2]|nr:hypothetical protein LPJ71_002630 [Coemansia sp. S17]KAJ2067334.1 hypothetical protein GGI08_001430 [Coemansia sp. S2]KAJ2096281.1 hypothetical protein GGI09_004437 [Coemansia sp. S100]